MLPPIKKAPSQCGVYCEGAYGVAIIAMLQTLSTSTVKTVSIATATTVCALNDKMYMIICHRLM